MYICPYIFIGILVINNLFSAENFLRKTQFSPHSNQWGKPFFETYTKNLSKELSDQNWTTDASLIIRSELPDQQAGIIYGDQNNHVRLTIGRLMITQGIAFNIGFYQTDKAPQFSPLPTFSSGQKIFLRIYKINKKIYASYSLDGKEYSNAGETNELTEISKKSIGLCLVDENRFKYQERVRQGSVSMLSVQLNHLKIRALNPSEIHLNKAQKIYTRLDFVELPKDQNPIKIACTLMEMQNQRLARWSVNRKGTLNSMTTAPGNPIRWQDFSSQDCFKQGEKTPWIDISPFFSNVRLHTVMAWSFSHGIQPVDSGEDSGDLKRYRIKIEFSTQPNESGVVHQIEESADFHRFALLIPSNEGSPEKWLKGIRSFTQYSKDTVDSYQKNGLYSLRQKASQSSFLFQGNMHDGIYLFGKILDPLAIQNFLKVGEFLGYNSNEYYVWPPWHPQFGYGKNDPLWKDIWNKNQAKYFKSFLQEDHSKFRDGWNRIRTDDRIIDYHYHDWDLRKPTFIKVGDEPHLFGPDILKISPEGIKEFQKYLLKINSNVENWGAKSWNEITPILKNEVKSSGEARRFYHQSFFLQKSFHQMHALYSQLIRNNFGPSAQTGTANYWAGFNISPDYFLEAKEGAFDIAMHHYGSGDTIGPRQTNADLWVADMLRSAATFGKIRQGILWFLCRIADENAARLSGITALSRGTQNIHFYGYGPRWTGWEWFVDDHWKVGTVKAAHDTVRMMLEFEKILIDGKQPKPQVAVGLSRGTSIWAKVESDQMVQIFGYAHEKEKRVTSDLPSLPAEGWNLERRMIHNALQWKCISADILPEEEIEVGRIWNYKVLYWTDPHLSLLARRELEKWIQSGGILFLGPQSATRSETNELDSWIQKLSSGTVSIDQQETNRVFKKYGGYQEVWETSSQYDQEEVHTLTPLGKINDFSGNQWNAIGIKEKILIQSSTPLIVDHQKNPCYVKFKYGKGMIYKSGISLGALYAKSAVPGYHERRGEENAPHTFINSASTSYLLKKHDDEIQNKILLPLTENFVSSPIKTNVRGIDAKLFEDQKSAALFIGKWTSEKTDPVEISVQLEKRYKSVTLWSGKKIHIKWNGSQAKMALPLEITDVISFKEPEDSLNHIIK